jgi:hypothetical protein
MGDALALRGDEGRAKLRKFMGSCKETVIRKCPNGATQWFEEPLPRKRGKRRELKHLSTYRRRKQYSDFVSSGERTRISPNLRCYGILGVVGHTFS